MARLAERFARPQACHACRRQKGVVLMVTLIALVTLALAALALIRSVDTNIIVAGNMALKQAATLSADNGVETAITWMVGKSIDDFNDDISGSGYFATVSADEKTDPDENPLKWSAETWASKGKPAEGGDITGGVDQGNNTIRYVIHRMCSEDGEPSVEKCLVVEGSAEGEGMHVQSGPKLDATGLLSPLYRITARVDGPRNTVSYVQTFVF